MEIIHLKSPNQFQLDVDTLQPYRIAKDKKKFNILRDKL